VVPLPRRALPSNTAGVLHQEAVDCFLSVNIQFGKLGPHPSAAAA
jgi:hypothetical protein